MNYTFLILFVLQGLSYSTRASLNGLRILASDGIDAIGQRTLSAAGFSLDIQKLDRPELLRSIADYDALIVRSATKVDIELLDAARKLKLVARAGVGLDNIDLTYAAQRNIAVVNTPAASSRSVAEMVFAHIFSGAHSLHLSNRMMPEYGRTHFKNLKLQTSKGMELFGKTIGIIGFGRIAQEVARIAIVLGMKVLIYDYKQRDFDLDINVAPMHMDSNAGSLISLKLPSYDLEYVLKEADIITVHTPGTEQIIGAPQLSQMKTGSFLINCARGGVVNEQDLVGALAAGQIAFVGLDVFSSEPPINDLVLSQESCSFSAHVGAGTVEAQQKVAIELAANICDFFNCSSSQT